MTDDSEPTPGDEGTTPEVTAEQPLDSMGDSEVEIDSEVEQAAERIEDDAPEAISKVAEEEQTSSTATSTPVADEEVEADEADAATGEDSVDTPEAEPSNKRWYVVKVASGREESIKAAIERRVKIDALEEFFGQIVIPVEKIVEVKKVKETKNGEKITKERRVTKDRKKFPGYLMAEVEFNSDILSLFRDTNGVGDFVGAAGPGKPPPPMSDIDVERMLHGISNSEQQSNKAGKTTVLKLDFEKGDKVRIRDGAFANYEGEVKQITEPKDGETPKVTVEVLVLGRPVPIELEHFQVDKI